MGVPYATKREIDFLDKSLTNKIAKSAEIVEVKKLPLPGWESTTVINNDYVNKVYFNQNMSTVDTVNLLDTLSYVEATEINNIPAYFMLIDKDIQTLDIELLSSLNVIGVLKIETAHVIVWIDNLVSMSIKVIFSDNLSVASELDPTVTLNNNGWNTNYLNLTIDSKVYNKFLAKYDVGLENEKIKSIFSLTEEQNIDSKVIYKLNAEKISYWRYIENNWVEVIKKESDGLEIPTINLAGESGTITDEEALLIASDRGRVIRFSINNGTIIIIGTRTTYPHPFAPEVLIYSYSATMPSWGYILCSIVVRGTEYELISNVLPTDLATDNGSRLGFSDGDVGVLGSVTLKTINNIPLIKHDQDNEDITLNTLPDAPTEDGNYVLKVTITGGVPSYTWVKEA